MEKRAILAFGLSMILLVAYLWVQEHYFAPPRPTSPPASGPGEGARVPAPETPPVPSPPPPPRVAASLPPATPPPPPHTAIVEGPLYRGVVSSDGGKLQEWTLHYRGEKPMVLVGEFGPAGLVVGPADSRDGQPLPMKIDGESLRLGAGRPAGEFVLTGGTEGLEVRESMVFSVDSYAITLRVRVRNATPSARAVVIRLPVMSRRSWQGVQERFPGQHPIEVVWSIGGSVDRAPQAMYPTLESIEEAPKLGREGDWIAIGSMWYLTALVPKSPGFRLMVSVERPAGSGEPKGANGRVTVEARATPTIAPGQTWEGEVLLFVGPKEYDRLRALGLEDTVNFGGFILPWYYGGLPMRWLGVPILLLMQWVYGYVGNYGIAIIVLTVLSKVLFYPLTVKSIRSMRAMQALQPQVNALRTKYKSEPQRAQREMMDLYRKHRVNPMGGCLPMIAQVPIFYALYLALLVSVELQNAAFLCFGRLFGVDLWICDLASHDPTYVLPVLMGVTMFVQQKMTPTTADPRQAKMMLVMPFVFTFMFLQLPSGLVLYWTVSNVLQIAQQWYMDRPSARAVREAKNARA